MTTVRELSKLIGTHVYMEPVRGLQFRCRISNAKISYGRQRVEVEAIEGQGRAWVNIESIQLQPAYEGGARD